ncbi:hypothetical protein K9L63_01450 [Candidatus Gracilibacteria bacterium]|nr:hypothetical protein [Candidatus Gracilibacteria bacterium]
MKNNPENFQNRVGDYQTLTDHPNWNEVARASFDSSGSMDELHAQQDVLDGQGISWKIACLETDGQETWFLFSYLPDELPNNTPLTPVQRARNGVTNSFKDAIGPIDDNSHPPFPTSWK